jgi:hypothetical protein
MGVEVQPPGIWLLLFGEIIASPLALTDALSLRAHAVRALLSSNFTFKIVEAVGDAYPCNRLSFDKANPQCASVHLHF